jgi:hypothetical protein
MSLPQVTLVDIHGKTISAEDCGDAASGPASNDVDGWYWEVSDDERAALEAEAFEAECDRRDPIDASCRWPLMFAEMTAVATATGRDRYEGIAGGNPSDDELGQIAAFGCV